jgi:hypothetical protein
MKQLLELRSGARWPDLRIGAAGPARTVSVLIFHDLQDTKVPLRDREAILRSWRDTRIIHTRGLGHHKILRDPRVVAQAVGFLATGAAIELRPASERVPAPLAGPCRARLKPVKALA